MKKKYIFIFSLIIIYLFTLPASAQTIPSLQNNTTVNTGLTESFPRKLVNMYDTIRIVFIGDVMQHGSQIRSALIKGKNPDSPKSYDYSNVFKYIEPILKRADIAAANMEFPMGGAPYKGYPLFSAPESIAWQAQKSGINLFLLANNHLLDMGKEGFIKTLKVYKNMQAKYIGAYLSAEDEDRENPVIFNIKGTKISVINFTYGTNGFPIPNSYKMNLMDSVHVKQTIKKAKDRGAEFIIAAPHWGEEYQLSPSEKQRNWAKMLFREGVKVILGSHPHVPQTAEIYYKQEQIPLSGKENKVPISNKEVDKLIFYSLGNYISNQSIPDYSQLELLVEVTLVKDNFTNKIIILQPDYKFMWCFKKNEFEEDYTVIPVKDLIDKEYMVPNKAQYKRMINTYKYILDKKLIKEIY